MRMPDHLWPMLGAWAAGLVVGVLAPGVARSLRAWIKRTDRDVRRTPTKDDDRRWELLRPFFVTLSDALERGDREAARDAIERYFQAEKERGRE